MTETISIYINFKVLTKSNTVFKQNIAINTLQRVLLSILSYTDIKKTQKHWTHP